MACDGHAHEHMNRMRMAFAANVYFVRFCEVRYKVALRCECALCAPYSPRIEECHELVLYKPHVSQCLTVVQWSSAYSLSTAKRARQVLAAWCRGCHTDLGETESDKRAVIGNENLEYPGSILSRSNR